MKKFSLSPAVIAVLVAGSASTSFAQIAQTKLKKESITSASKKSRKGEGASNTGGITLENGEGSTNTGGYTFESDDRSGTNVGGSEDGINFIANPWNTGVIAILQETRTSATYNFADNKVDTAIKMFELQLEAVAQQAEKFPDLRLSWTKTIANRTLDITGRLEAEIKNADDRVALFNVYLTSYETIEKFYKLDTDYIIPYNKNRKNKDFLPNTSGMEYELKRYIVTQGNWFTERFIAGTNEYGTLPKYSPRVALVALSSLAKGLAEDLIPAPCMDSANGPNLFPHAFEETAAKLQRISSKIENHLSGGDVFGGPDRHDRAINDSYKALMSVVNSVR